MLCPEAQTKRDREREEEVPKAPELDTDSPLQVGRRPNVPEKNVKSEGERSPTPPTEQIATRGPFAEDDDGTENEAQESKSSLHPLPKETTRPSSQPRPVPLKERSPNSPTGLPISPSKTVGHNPSISRHNSDRDALTDAITSLLAHHKGVHSHVDLDNKSTISKRALSNSVGADNAESTRRRRTRQLLGRAASNLSNRSGSGNALPLNTGLSRASSIGTLNTDDLGTPIDTSVAAPGVAVIPAAANAGVGTVASKSISLTTSALTSHDELLATENDDDYEAVEKPVQLTQVGYEDPEAGKWRARLMRKIGARQKGKDGQMEEEGETAHKGGRGKGNDAEIAAAGAAGTLQQEGGVARRTRGSTAAGRA